MPQGKRRGKPRTVRRSKMRASRRIFKGNGNSEGTSRVLPAIAPPHQVRGMAVRTTAVISGAAPAVIKRWNPNSAYTPETGGGSGATPGYADLAQLYGYYRVRLYRYEIVICNLEAFGVTVYVINSNNDPTTSNNSTLGSNPRSQEEELSAKGGQDRITFRGEFSITNIVGNPSPKYDDIYAALINASPADITWLGVGVQSSTGANVANGVAVLVSLWQEVDFYDNQLQIFKLAHTPEQYTTFCSQRANVQHLQASGREVELKIPASQEQEAANKKDAFEKFARVAQRGVPLSTLAKYTHVEIGHIPFKIVY